MLCGYGLRHVRRIESRGVAESPIPATSDSPPSANQAYSTSSVQLSSHICPSRAGRPRLIVGKAPTGPLVPAAVNVTNGVPFPPDGPHATLDASPRIVRRRRAERSMAGQPANLHLPARRRGAWAGAPPSNASGCIVRGCVDRLVSPWRGRMEAEAADQAPVASVHAKARVARAGLALRKRQARRSPATASPSFDTVHMRARRISALA